MIRPPSSRRVPGSATREQSRAPAAAAANRRAADPANLGPWESYPTRVSEPSRAFGDGAPGYHVTKRQVGGWSGLVTSLRLQGAEHISAPFEEDVWVHTCLRMIANAVRGVRLRFWEVDPREDSTAKPVPDDHPLQRLLDRPNPHQTRGVFADAALLHRKLDGENFWAMFGRNGRPIPFARSDDPSIPGTIDLPTYLIPVRGRAMRLRRSETGVPHGWAYSGTDSSSGDSSQVELEPAQVVHFRDYDPGNPLRGLGDVDVLLRWLEVSHQAQRYVAALVKNGGDPGGFIEVVEELRRQDERALERQANEAFGAENRGRWKVVSGKNGVRYRPNPVSPKDMEFRLLLEWVRDATCSTLGVPLPVVGIFDAATFDNYRQAVEQFWEGGNGVLSYLGSEESTINSSFLPRLKDPAQASLVARYDLRNVEALQDDLAGKLDTIGKLRERNPELSFEAAAGIVGAEFPGNASTATGGVHLVPSGWQTLDDVLEPPEPPPSTDDDPDDPDEVEDDPDEEPEDDERRARPRRREAGEESDPEIEAREERVAYWRALESNVLVPGETSIARAYRRWSRRYEAATIARLRSFAEEGPEALEDEPPEDPSAPPLSDVGVAGYNGDEEPDATPNVEQNGARAALLEGDVRTATDRARERLGYREPPAGSSSDPTAAFVAGDLGQNDVAALAVNQREWAIRLDAALGLPIEGIFFSAAEDLAEELGGIALGVQDPLVVGFLRDQRIKLVEGHTSTLATKVREALLREFSGSTNTGTLQELVLQVLPDLEGSLRRAFRDRESRALTIARTETAHASNGARFEQMAKEGVETHEWVTSGDLAVRGTPGGPYADAEFSHYELDGREVPVGEVFARSLRHPSDPAGAAGDVINCRCTTRPGKRREPSQ